MAVYNRLYSQLKLHHFEFGLNLHEAAAVLASRGFVGAFALDTGLLVELTLAKLGKDAGLLAFFLEALQSAFDRLIVVNFDGNQKKSPRFLFRMPACLTGLFRAQRYPPRRYQPLPTRMPIIGDGFGFVK